MEQSGIHLGLERMEELLNRMGRPEAELKIIHVAGTNGKGSVSTFIASILEAAGYSVGRYISPTLFDYRERIQINNCWIEKEELAQGMSLARSHCESMVADGLEAPTIFEIETAVGFWYFKKKKCDYVVLEVGMGGRLDSTNVIKHPVLSVITSVSMDHMAQLGNTLSEIAAEKAGIIKEEIPVILYPQKTEAMEVFIKTCEKLHCTHTMVDLNQVTLNKRCLVEADGKVTAHQIFDYKNYKQLSIHLAGTYQIKNACLAIEAIEALGFEENRISCIYEGLEKASWAGRFQCLSAQPTIFIDGAHNPEGAESLRESIQSYFPEQKKILVMGVFKDKDYESILKIMSTVSDTLITFTPENARGLESHVLEEKAKAYFKHTVDAQSSWAALEKAEELWNEDSVIIIFGSLSTISAFCDILEEKTIKMIK